MKAPDITDQIVKVQAGLTDEGFGYDRWMADQISGGRFNCPSLLIIFNTDSERNAAYLKLKERLINAINSVDLPLGQTDSGTDK